MKRTIAMAILSFMLGAGRLSAADAWQAPSPQQIDSVYPQMEALYMDLHRHPELSLHEEKTAAKIADQLRKLGYDVTTGVGGTGVVGVLKNGPGPVVAIRAELDALPVPERTGLPYASHVTTRNDLGIEVPVMHACGHDLHMSVGMGTAALLAQNKDHWHGTFIYIGQPAEERIQGATAMLREGLFTRFPKPDFVFAVHDSAGLPAGKVGYTPGYSASNADSVDVTIFGKGGHGSAPQVTVDPIVIAARTILAWQTIVSRETNPQDPAVVTVGTIQGGTKNNIIPDEVRLSLTVRTYKEEVRRHVLAAIERIADAEAEAAGAETKPEVKVFESVAAVYNDPVVTGRVVAALQDTLGKSNVVQEPPVMASDDFAEYRRDGVPIVMLELGAADPATFAAAEKSGRVLPGPHSPLFAPDLEPSLKTGILVETTAVLDLLSQR
ncbi:MAG TPA: amidohydrolase [Terriglobales bacterium]|nr:amidohydrolase [Terriglobales bacterium]